MQKNTIQTLYHLGALVIISYCTIFANNGLPGLDIMEIRNIVTAREMVSDNTWLLPTMNGEIRIEKPPLPTWLTAFPVILTHSDDNLGSLRVPAGIAAILMVFFVYFFAKALSDSSLVAFFSAIVVATSEFLIIMGKRESWDIFCHAFMIGAICFLFLGWKNEKTSFGVFLTAGILMGLSFLSKGPIAFHSTLLPFLVSYLYAYGYKPITRKWRGTAAAILICCTISVLWPLYLYTYLPDAAVAVGTKELHTWVAYKAKPLWYYLPFPIHSGIWVCLLISALFYPLIGQKDSFCKDKKKYTFLLAWIFLTVFLLTVIPKKSTHYLLPVIVPVSLLIGLFMQHLLLVYGDKEQPTADKITVTIHEIVVLLLSLAGLVTCLYNDFWFSPNSPTIHSLPISIFIGIALYSFYFFKKKAIVNLFMTTVILVCSICLFMPPIVYPMVTQKSFMTLKLSRKDTAGQNILFYSSYEMDIKEIWAVGKKVVRKEIDDLEEIHDSFVYFTKQDPTLLFHGKKMLLRIQSTHSYLDSDSNETWYVSVMSKI